MPPSATPTIDVTDVEFSRLSDYCGLWSIEPTRGLTLFDRIGNSDLLAHILANTKRDERDVKSVPAPLLIEYSAAAAASPAQGGDKQAAAEPVTFAVVQISGTLMKHASSFDASTSTVRLRRQIATLANDPSIAGILLVIDSPGGSVSGTEDLAAAVRKANEQKPVHAFGEDLVASAALWVAVSAERFVVNAETAMVGSIGTFIGTYDYSAAAGQKGIKAKVYATGPLKGTGFPGAEITAEQDQYLQSIVDETQQHFTAAVAKGRKLPIAKVKELATGGTYIAANALKHGLIDGIESYDQALSNLAAAWQRRNATSNNGRKAEETIMPPESNAPAAAPAAAAPAPAPAAAPAAAAQPAPAAEPSKPAAAGQRYLEAFGQQGGVYFAEGLSFEEAQSRHIASLTSQLNTANETIKTQKASVDALRGEAAPVSGDPDPKDKKDPKAAGGNRFQGKLSEPLGTYASSLNLAALNPQKKN
jgi:signal peptide peptidase SppA